MILRAPEHTPTSLWITPTHEANPDTATTSLLQQPVQSLTHMILICKFNIRKRARDLDI
jgi:hypothetical protein